MTRFHYRAARADGGTVRGMLEAATPREAAAVLSRRGLFPTRVMAHAARDPWWRRPSARARATVLQSLASLVEAGVPVQRALEATARTATGSLRDAVLRVAETVNQGASLAAALSAERNVFSPVTVGLVRGGERGVGLGAALTHAAQQLEREAETTAHLRAALAYPLVLAAVGSLSIVTIAVVVVPRFRDLLADVDGALPPATRALLMASTVAQTHGVWILGVGLLAAVLGLHVVRRHPAAVHRRLLEAPIVGPLRSSLATARACRTLSALLRSGLSAFTALDVTRESVGDREIARRLAAARDHVAEGMALSTALASSRALTPLALQLIAIGEGSGGLPALAAKAADLEDSAAARRLRTVVSLLEPCLILVFAALVAFVAIAILQGIYSVRPV